MFLFGYGCPDLKTVLEYVKKRLKMGIVVGVR